MPVSSLDEILRADPLRMELLRLVREKQLPDGWIGAGFVRDAVWDALHDRERAAPTGDVDVVWFDPSAGPAVDVELERWLAADEPSVRWSVKNQARMHLRNGDPPYGSTAHAMEHWPETATAVGVRLDADDRLVVLAPLGLEDLLGGVLRPTAWSQAHHPEVFPARVRDKQWLTRYPRLICRSRPSACRATDLEPEG